ncbi:lasso peptide biosynthesis B2 protein [Scytonema hofmannii FACHB-248]|uniref:Lasso peptide biosynthesis B2 protein n=1 Tax=Scytonema hofmannii FACHB-248 TaxID=1842502 RepID=A0ABR8GQ31_9CYAN|nr:MULTISPECIES: lasso peptide biosynthesis B2 protein [Nostocales]MBD2605341.1 lasso peptide biosynthesis B2 protein [Scytonema hofmannii FACHB-248]
MGASQSAKHTLRDRQLLIMTLIILATIRLGLWIMPFRTLLKVLAKVSRQSDRLQVTNPVSVRKIAWAVNAVSRYMPGVKCLARALTTQVLMSRYGHSCELRIGVAKGEKGTLEAHAWIEHQGRVVMGYLVDLSRFIPLPSLQGVKL